MKTKNLQKQLRAYIKDKHTQEECTGFIDGYNSAKKYYKILIQYIISLIVYCICIEIIVVDFKYVTHIYGTKFQWLISMIGLAAILNMFRILNNNEKNTN